MDMIRKIEKISMNAWPALETVRYDGWTLRFADGVTKRSNSVNPINGSTLDIETKIAHCESLYRCRNLPACFKLTEAVFPPDLDSILGSRGYSREFEISVQLADLKTAGTGIDDRVLISENTDEEWIYNLIRMDGMSPFNGAVIRKIIEKIALPKCVVTLTSDGAAAGCGLGVVEGQYIGLFEIVIDPAHRNKGLGEVLIRNMQNWGRGQGAETAYLQVLADNAPAIRLYEKTGFSEVYRYWYRIKRK